MNDPSEDPQKDNGIFQADDEFGADNPVMLNMPQTESPPLLRPITQIIIQKKPNNDRFTPSCKVFTPNLASGQILTSDFVAAMGNPQLLINPVDVGFIPRQYWVSQPVTFGSLVTDFFQKKNNPSCRFSHKLFNALKLANLSNKDYSSICGVAWVTDRVFKVDKSRFAQLLGIRSIEGSLFHQQGNFPSHGFVEISAQDAKNVCPSVDLSKIDFVNSRLMMHPSMQFTIYSTEDDVNRCKWDEKQTKM